MVDTHQIFIKLLNMFTIRGTYHIDPDTGVVNVQGDVRLAKPVSEMPIQFGKVTGYFNCMNQSLTTLKGAPHEVGGYFNCSYNKLVDLTHAPRTVGDAFFTDQNPLVSLDGAPDSIAAEFICGYSAHLPLLRTLNSKGPIKLTSFKRKQPPPQVEEILNRYAGQGKPGAIKAASELIRAGYKDNARW